MCGGVVRDGPAATKRCRRPSRTAAGRLCPVGRRMKTRERDFKSSSGTTLWSGAHWHWKAVLVGAHAELSHSSPRQALSLCSATATPNRAADCRAAELPGRALTSLYITASRPTSLAVVRNLDSKAEAFPIFRAGSRLVMSGCFRFGSTTAPCRLSVACRMWVGASPLPLRGGILCKVEWTAALPFHAQENKVAPHTRVSAPRCFHHAVLTAADDAGLPAGRSQQQPNCARAFGTAAQPAP